MVGRGWQGSLGGEIFPHEVEPGNRTPEEPDPVRDAVSERLEDIIAIMRGEISGVLVTNGETGEITRAIDRSNVLDEYHVLHDEFLEVYPDLFPEGQTE